MKLSIAIDLDLECFRQAGENISHEIAEVLRDTATKVKGQHIYPGKAMRILDEHGNVLGYLKIRK